MSTETEALQQVTQENMEIWNSANQPPKMALKPIEAGRLIGKTSINPQWRLEMLTKLFGPQGFGWRYTIEELWTTPGGGNEIIAHARILLYVKVEGEWSEGIPGVGGKVLVKDESKGPFSNDEAFKMALTDALSVSCKGLGFGADVHYNLWDGDKYRNAGADESKVTHWIEKCAEASEGPIEQYEKWWPRNKGAIVEDCGEEGAAKVYNWFADKLKEVRRAKD